MNSSFRRLNAQHNFNALEEDIRAYLARLLIPALRMCVRIPILRMSVRISALRIYISQHTLKNIRQFSSFNFHFFTGVLATAPQSNITQSMHASALAYISC
jgi:hypothetical protein